MYKFVRAANDSREMKGKEAGLDVNSGVMK